MLGCFFFLQPFITSIFFTSPSPIVWKSDKMAAILGMTQLPLDWKKKEIFIVRLALRAGKIKLFLYLICYPFKHDANVLPPLSPPPPRGIYRALDALRLKIQLIGVKQYQNQI